MLLANRVDFWLFHKLFIPHPPPLVVMTVTEKEIRERDRLQKAIEQRMKKEERLKECIGG